MAEDLLELPDGLGSPSGPREDVGDDVPDAEDLRATDLVLRAHAAQERERLIVSAHVGERGAGYDRGFRLRGIRDRRRKRFFRERDRAVGPAGGAQGVCDDVVLVGPAGHALVGLHLREGLLVPALSVQGEPEHLADGRGAARGALRLRRFRGGTFRVAAVEERDRTLEVRDGLVAPARTRHPPELRDDIARQARAGRLAGTRLPATGTEGLRHARKRTRRSRAASLGTNGRWNEKSRPKAALLHDVPAATYSPTRLPGQYHRRWRA